MAHECPNCGLTCYCNWDIDDIIFDEQIDWCCRHCLENYDDDYEADDWLDSEDE